MTYRNEKTMIVHIPHEPAVRNPRRTTTHRRALASTLLAMGLALTLIAAGTTEARSGPAPIAEPASTSIPDTPAGRQLRWFLEATKSQPIPVPAIEEHFSAAFLAQLPPDQLNLYLDQSGYSTLVFLSVVGTTEMTIEVAVDFGTGGPPVVFGLEADADGRITGFAFPPKFVPLSPRAERGLAPVSLPRPTGWFAVGTETFVVTDAARDGRRIPVQLWYPADRRSARKSSPAQYALPATSATIAEQLAVPVEDVAAIRTNAFAGPDLARTGRRLPVVLFSPGFGVSRFFYSGLAADLASHGYVVAVLEHPGEYQPVEFPDGSIVAPGDVDSEEAEAALLPVRIADIGAAQGLLVRLDAKPGARMHNALDLGRVALAGHSFGGAAAAEAMRLDQGVRAGINLDGTMYGRVVDTGLDRPFLLLGFDGHVEHDPTWTLFRTRSARTTTFEIAGTAHMNFTDLPALFAFRSPDEPREFLEIGAIDPRRSTKIQTAFVRAFLDHHLRNKPTPLLDGPSRRYPEVRFS
jgi:dienelactone hydrolase